MDEQQQAQQNAEQVQDPTQPVTEQPQEPQPEQPTQPEQPQEQPQSDQPTDPATSDQAIQDVQNAVQEAGNIDSEPVDPTQDFIDSYNALCQEKGKQFKFQLTFNVSDDGSFDLTKAVLNRLVVDLPQE